MTLPSRTGEKPIQFSLKIPKEYGDEIDRLKDLEGTTGAAIILRAIIYWLKTDGKATADSDLLERITSLETELKNLRDEENNRFAELRKEKTLKDEEHNLLLKHQKKLEEKNRQIDELMKSLNTLQESLAKQQNTIEKMLELIGK